jgi:hypothetical protein
VAVLGGFVMGVVGFLVVLVIAEWLWVDWFADHDLAEGLLFAVFVGGGAFVGSRLLPRIAGRIR